MEEYLTLLEESHAEYEEKRSRFLSVAIPCTTEEEVTERLAEIRSKYWDARHNVYAYILKNGASRFSDDSEPHGTAGKPVLDVLSGSGLVDVLVVVTRYFGGTLLGTGGLVRAYSTAAREALANAQRVRMCPCVTYEIACTYPDHQRLSRLLSDYNATVEDTVFGADVTVCFALQEESCENFIHSLTETFSAKLTARELKRDFSPIII